MATLYVSEFATQGIDARGHMMVVADVPMAAEQTVAITGASVQSSTFNPLTKFVRISTDSICSIKLGTNPTATTTTMRMAANTAEYFSIPLGASWRVAVISNT